MESLPKILTSFCDANGIKYSFVAKYIGCDQKRFFKWLYGSGKMEKEQQKKIWEFLNGDFLTPFDAIVEVKEG